MVRSRLPLPSLLGLLGALLMLSPEPLLGERQVFSDLPVTDPGLQKVLALAMEQYNRSRRQSITYFKETRDEYHVSVDLVETTCKKWTPWIFNYEKIQACKELPGTQEKPTCYFKVTRDPPQHEMILEATIC